MRRLILTADDFGVAIEVNDAVEQAHRQGILTTTSLMVAAPAAEDAVARARNLPNLRIGLHLVLVDGKALLPSNALPDLVDCDGFIRSDMARMGAKIFFLPHVRRQVAREIAAQFAAFAATGLRLDHVNAHKHFHLHPTIASLIVEIGRAYGVKNIRVPQEPRRILAEVETVRPSAMAALTTPFAQMMRQRFAQAGISSPDHVFGLAWSGAMTADRLAGLLTHLPEGLSEIYMHPATAAYPGSAPGYLYREELAALTDPRMTKLIAAGDIQLGGFLDFPL